MRSLALAVAALLALYVAWLALLYAGQRSMMFPGAGLAADAALPPGPPGVEPVSVGASFGQVRGYFLPGASAGTAPAILYFHGNAELAGHNIALLQPVAELGVHVLIVEYPGYAGGDGRPGRDTLDEAASIGFDWLALRPDVDPARIVAMGRSIGSGPATALTADRPVAALVLLSAFASLEGFAYRMGAPGFLIRDRWNNSARLRDYSGPVLLFHGRMDRIIPIAHSRALARAAPRAQLETLDCGHNDCPYFDPGFIDSLEAFLQQSGVLAPRDSSQSHPAGPREGPG